MTQARAGSSYSIINDSSFSMWWATTGYWWMTSNFLLPSNNSFWLGCRFTWLLFYHLTLLTHLFTLRVQHSLQVLLCLIRHIFTLFTRRALTGVVLLNSVNFFGSKGLNDRAVYYPRSKHESRPLFWRVFYCSLLVLHSPRSSLKHYYGAHSTLLPITMSGKRLLLSWTSTQVLFPPARTHYVNHT